MPAQRPLSKEQSRLFLILPIIIVCLLLGLVAITVAFFLNRDTPEKAAKRYFAALEKRDAPAALDQTVPVANRRLLTSAVLRHSAENGGAVKLVSVTGDHVVYLVGKTQVETRMKFQRVDGQFRVLTPVATVRTTGVLAGTTIGEADVASGPLVLFPGRYRVTPAQPSLTITPNLIQVLDPQKDVTFAPGYKLSNEGQVALRQQTSAALAACVAKNELSPAGCPWKLLPPTNATLDPKTVRVEMVESSADETRFQVESGQAVGRVTARLKITAKVDVRGKQTDYSATPTITAVSRINLDGEPPKVTWTGA